MTHLNTATPKARRDHRCDLCGNAIHRHTVHLASRHVSDGEAYTFRAHLACWAVVTNHPDGSDPDWDGVTADSFAWTLDELADGAEEWPAALVSAYDALPLAEQERLIEMVTARQITLHDQWGVPR